MCAQYFPWFVHLDSLPISEMEEELMGHRNTEEEEEMDKDSLELENEVEPYQTTTKENLEEMEPVEGMRAGGEQDHEKEGEDGNHHSNSNCSPIGRWNFSSVL